jgi:hypothetical protein
MLQIGNLGTAHGQENLPQIKVVFNKTDNASVTQHHGACAYSLYLLGYPNSTIPFHSKRAPSWLYNVTENNNMYLGLHVKCPIRLYNFNQIFISVTDLPKRPQYKIHGNPSSGSRADTCEQADTQTDRRTDVHHEGHRRFS